MGDSIDSKTARQHSLASDGERFLPGIMTGDIELEHLHRYKFASQLSAKKTVLDIASGEGYGSAYLARVARRVIGVDISPEAIESASAKYRQPNLDFLVGSCADIPLEDATVDVVVSFETIEHHAEHEAMMREIKRVLRPRGLIIISSPDKREYSDKPSFHNPFHVKELYREEFHSLLEAHFRCVRIFGQRVLAGSMLLSEGEAQGLVFHDVAVDSIPQGYLPSPKYLIAIASDRQLPIIKGGLLEGHPDTRDAGTETSAKALATILRSISVTGSQYLRNRLNDPWYLQRNPDVATNGIDPVAHWLEHGAKEGRLPAFDIEEFAQELISERDATSRAASGKAEHELLRNRQEMLERQHVLEAQLEQMRSSAREDAATHLRILADQELAFSRQFLQQQVLAREEREAQGEASEQRLKALNAQQEKREQGLRAEIHAKEQELSRHQEEALERERALEEVVEQTRLEARLEVEAHLRMLVERERAVAEQFSHQQQSAREEREAQRDTFDHQLKVLGAQYEERELRLRAAIEQKERDFRTLQGESVEQRKGLEAVIGQNRIAANYAVEAQLRALVERERAFAEQLSLQHKLANEEREAQREATNRQLQALRAQHDERERQLRIAIEDKERELRQTQGAAEVHLQTLVDRERAVAEQMSLQQRLANEDKEAQREHLNRQMLTLKTHHEERERELRAMIQEKERGLLKSKEAADVQLRMLVDRERAVAEQMSLQQRLANEQREVQRVAVNRQIQTLNSQRDEREQELRVVIQEKERDSRQSREEIEVQLRAMVQRERAFAADFAYVTDIVDEERRLLREQYSTIVHFIRSVLDSGERRSWRRLRRTPFETESVWTSRSEAAFSPFDFPSMGAPSRRGVTNDRPITQTPDSETTASGGLETRPAKPPRRQRFLNNKAKTIEELLSYDGHDFIACTYLTLLGRKPDAEGHAFYMQELRGAGGKGAVICQIGTSREAKQYRAEIKGLRAFIRRQKWKKIPFLGALVPESDRDPLTNQLRPILEEVDHRIETLEKGILSRLSTFRDNKLPTVAAQVDSLFRSFDERKYVDANPDVAASGMNPYEHYLRFGWREGRRLELTETSAEEVRDGLGRGGERSAVSNGMQLNVEGADQLSIAATDVVPVESALVSLEGKWSCLNRLAVEPRQRGGHVLTRLMLFIWQSRRDLQNAYDIHEENGRLEYLKWLATHGICELALTASVFPRELLESLVNLGSEIGALADQALHEQHSVDYANGRHQEKHISSAGDFGANLVGYAFGEFGRGEDVRMVARSLNSLNVPFVIINQDVGLHGTGDASVADWIVSAPKFNTNVFLINADLFPFLPFKLEEGFCCGRYNIGYWAWELSKWPAEFDLALDMVDEVWAISEFVAESIKTKARVPVITMPNAVTVPKLGTGYTKLHYGLPTDSFVFYFSFDAASHLERKNPQAVVRAFNLAFPDSRTSAHLLLKTMNVEVGGPLWEELQKEIAGNPHITILANRMSREEVLGLNLACDAFISLHRSEGFGRCVAEAMAYGLPVIVTNYSGTRDFAKEGTACLVDYRLIPVPKGAYPFCDGQVWADPDIDCAAAHMRQIMNDEPYRRETALAGQKFILENFSQESIGKLYANRLKEIQALRTITPARVDSAPDRQDEADTVLGSIDAPTADQCLEASDTLPIEGWAASAGGIETVGMYVDSKYVGEAHYGILRPDIHGAFPQLPNAGRSGFCYLLNIADLADGDHSFSAVARCRNGASRTWTNTFYKRSSFKYQEWLRKSEELYIAKNVSGTHASREIPISLVLRLGNEIDTALLTETLRSLSGQQSSNFELLCLLEDAAQESIVVDAALRVDFPANLKCLVGNEANWISIVEHCRGELIGLVDPGDRFRPWAFSEIGWSIAENGPVDLIYADEDTCGSSDRGDPMFKPGWSPIFFENYNYIGRPWFASRSAWSSAASDLSLEGADVDEHKLLKVILRENSVVGHVPTVLLSRSTGGTDVRRQRVERGDTSEWCADGFWPRVSIIIPTRLGDEALIAKCFDGLQRRTDYPNLEVIVVINNLLDPASVERDLAARPFKVVNWEGGFNWAGINNLGATYATGDHLLFMNDDVEPLVDNWLKVLVRTLERTRAGVAGCLLKYPNGTIQHSGVHFVNYGGGARHLFRFCRGDEERLRWLMEYPREVSAVTGACLLTTRDCFNAVNGFDEELPLVGNDTDYCLRVWREGLSVIIQPKATLIHHEGVSRAGISEVKDVERFWKKWGRFLHQGDFFTNPNLDLARDDWTVNANIQDICKFRMRYVNGRNDNREEKRALEDEGSPFVKFAETQLETFPG